MWHQKAFMPWVQMPAEGLINFLNQLSWNKNQGGSAAGDVAAVMIYVVLLFVRSEEVTEEPVEIPEFLGLPKDATQMTIQQIAAISYDQLEEATGLSRSLIRQGLRRLLELNQITSEGSKQKRIYLLNWPGGRWAKLPCRAIATKQGINAFKTFTLRNKHELNALKLYLYIASIRSRDSVHSEVSYELINTRLGIQERDIRRAINILIAADLLAQVNREVEKLENTSWGPNKYYLKGYGDLNVANSNRTTDTATKSIPVTDYRIESF